MEQNHTDTTRSIKLQIGIVLQSDTVNIHIAGICIWVVLSGILIVISAKLNSH